ncbi:MAG: adenylate/guanylate cyclase domain-containing protein [Chloroflexi bacterium]|nr:adenylate/guanylate cyclase domain-containing protein [Chloroflexota bacterium]
MNATQTLLKKTLALATRIGADPLDSDDLRLQKSSLVLAAFMFIAAGAAWGAMYFLFGEPVAGAIPLSYSIVSLVSVVTFHLTRRYETFRFSQLLFILLLPFLLMITLGGFVYSSGVILWSLICPLGALLFDQPRAARRWLTAYLALVALSGLLQPFVGLRSHLSPALITLFFVLNIGMVSAITVTMLYYFVGEKNSILHLLRAEQEKSENLLLNILPKEIAAILKNERRTIADHYDGASILFADMVGFTPLSAELAPVEMVELLNEAFSHFDSLVEKYNLEKIRTIGDNYMVASGVPRRRADHAQALTRMALEIRDFVQGHEYQGGRRVSFRIGINSGPVIAGVIGRKKFVYDLWGDAVNIASRMESHGAGGQVQITRATYDLIKDDFVCEPRGAVPVKGKGEMEVWHVVSAQARPSVADGA